MISIVISPVYVEALFGLKLTGVTLIDVGVVPFPGVAEKNEPSLVICQESGSWLPILVKEIFRYDGKSF